ncbi:MAG: hypothetical protein ACTSRA_19200 [Promethearchaeota archaeon]
MVKRTIFLFKLILIFLSCYWAIIFSHILYLASAYDSWLIEPWGMDYLAIVIFIMSGAILGILLYSLIRRFQEKKTSSIWLLTIIFTLFLASLVLSLLLEFLFFIDIIGKFLNRTIFVLLTMGMAGIIFFVLDIFEGGVNYPFDPSIQSHSRFIRIWILVIITVAFIILFICYLTISIFRALTPVEFILETLPVLFIVAVDLFSLLFKPLAIYHRTENKHERIGLIALFLSGVVLLLFLVFYIIHNILISTYILPQEQYLHRMDYPFYYLSIVLIPVFLAFSYLGLIYPIGKK